MEHACKVAFTADPGSFPLCFLHFIFLHFSSTRQAQGLDRYSVGCTMVWLRSSGWSAQSPGAVHGLLESLVPWRLVSIQIIGWSHPCGHTSPLPPCHLRIVRIQTRISAINHFACSLEWVWDSSDSCVFHFCSVIFISANKIESWQFWKHNHLIELWYWMHFCITTD